MSPPSNGTSSTNNVGGGGGGAVGRIRVNVYAPFAADAAAIISPSVTTATPARR